MCYVEPGKPDIFVSYAHVDDKPLPNEAEGRVSTFVRVLNTFLARKLGSEKAFELLFDPQLATGQKLSGLESLVRGSAVLLVVLSEGFLRSDWCSDKELRWFLDEDVKSRKSDPNRSRVFVVELDPVERPVGLEDVLGVRLWEADPISKRPRTLDPIREHTAGRYNDKVLDLCLDLVKELDLQKAAGNDAGEAPTAPVQPQGFKATVYLAEVTDDLEDLRDDVRRYLDQAGYRVLPRYVYPNDPMGFSSAVRSDLAESSLFVQLLGPLQGRKLDGTSRRRVAEQLVLAREATSCTSEPMPILQWRDRGFDVRQVADEKYRTFLEGPEVEARDIEEFKSSILRRLTRPREQRPEKPDLLVFVNWADSDVPLASSVKKELDERAIDYVEPIPGMKPEMMRKDLEQNLTECDTLILIYGASDPLWVKSQLLLSRKMMCKRTRPLSVIGVYEGPPPENKNDLGIRISNVKLHHLKCHGGPVAAEFDAFFGHFRQESRK
jgi:hypothetical protein